MQFAKRLALSIVMLAALCAVFSEPAQSQASQAEIKSLVTQYVAAFNAKDVTRLRALYHPQSLQCITPQNKDFYDDSMAMQMRDSIPANYTYKASPVNEENLEAFASILRFPVKPTQDLQIDSQQGNDVSSTQLWIVRENGHLLIDWPCPTDQAVKEYHDDAPARAKLHAETKALAGGIKEPLRSQLMDLLRQHDTAEAIDRYKQASGKDSRTSMLVIDQLAHEQKQ